MGASNGNSSGLPALVWGLLGVGAVMATQALLSQRRKIDYRGKTVVITGGSRGLGLVMARQLAREGAKVAICARDQDELKRAEADLHQYGNFIFAHACDITDKDQVLTFIQAVRGHFGPVDVLINNAGTITVSPYEHTTDDDFQDAMGINFWAGYHLINAVLPLMRERQFGRIINVASFGGKVAIPHMLPYVASKFAMVGFSEGLRAELMKDGIYVTTICPGLVRTGSPVNVFFKGQAEKEYAWFKTGDSLPILSVSAERCAREIIEAGRYGKAEVVISVPAQAASLFHGMFPGLSSDLSAVVNGLLPAPGGIGEQRALGKDIESKLTKNVLTAPTDKAAVANNQLAG